MINVTVFKFKQSFLKIEAAWVLNFGLYFRMYNDLKIKHLSLSI